MEAICAAFETEPKGCVRFLEKENIVLDPHDGVSAAFLFTIIGILVCGMLIAFFFYRRYLKHEMHEDMKVQVSA